MDFFETVHMIETQYPQYYALLQYDPQILQIFIDANQDPASWPPERIKAAIAATPWFQSTPATERTFLALNAADPATARQKVDNTNFTVQQMVRSLGINIDPTALTLLTLNATAQGWDQNRIQAELLAQSGDYIGLPRPGMIADTIYQYNSLADQYGVPMSGGDLQWWAKNTLAGNTTKEGFQSYLVQQAASLYPALGSRLIEGISVAQFAQPYLALAQKELGLNPADINLRDPKWTSLFLGNDDKGTQGVRSLDEALAKIRSDPQYGYDTSMNGRQAAAQFAQQIGQMFGTAA